MKGRLFQSLLATRREFLSARRTVESLFDLQPAGVREFRRTLLDTFDGRLRRAGRWLEIDTDGGAGARLRAAGGEAEYEEQALPAAPSEPVTLPDGPVTAALGPLLGGRALLTQCTLRIRASDFRLVDREGKIRARLSREQVLDATASARGRTRLNVLRLWPLRGYEKTCRRVFDELGTVLDGMDVEIDPAQRCVALYGARVDAPVNVPVPLRPRQSAGRALGLVLLRQMQIMERNVDGILADADTEFLHDFRIACRRSRSLLTQMRGAFPAQSTEPYRDAFAWLSRVTSPQRDLDVFLAALPALAARLSDRHARALAPLQALLADHRRVEHERLAQTLAGARFRGFSPDWRRFLDEFAGPRAPRNQSGPFAVDIAGRTLKRLYQRLLRNGARCGIGAYSPELHELRKDGKKLRYVLEAFRTLYPQPDVDEVVRRLRKLQNVLGAIVDFHVQRQWLQQWHQELLARPDTDPLTLAAMTALGDELDRMGLDAQQGFVRRFGRFAAVQVRDAMARLLEQRP